MIIGIMTGVYMTPRLRAVSRSYAHASLREWVNRWHRAAPPIERLFGASASASVLQPIRRRASSPKPCPSSCAKRAVRSRETVPVRDVFGRVVHPAESSVG